MRPKEVDKRQGKTKYYLANDPRGMAMITIMLLLGCFVIYLLYRCYEIGLLRGSIILIVMLYFIFILFDCTWISVDQKGISLHSFVRRKKSILWNEVCCCGYFYHYIYIGQKRRYFYISRKPLLGGINALGLSDMPQQTDDFIFVAEQRDAETVISQHLPHGRF